MTTTTTMDNNDDDRQQQPIPEGMANAMKRSVQTWLLDTARDDIRLFMRHEWRKTLFPYQPLDASATREMWPSVKHLVGLHRHELFTVTAGVDHYIASINLAYGTALTDEVMLQMATWLLEMDAFRASRIRQAFFLTNGASPLEVHVCLSNKLTFRFRVIESTPNVFVETSPSSLRFPYPTFWPIIHHVGLFSIATQLDDEFRFFTKNKWFALYDSNKTEAFLDVAFQPGRAIKGRGIVFNPPVDQSVPQYLRADRFEWISTSIATGSSWLA